MTDRAGAAASVSIIVCLLGSSVDPVRAAAAPASDDLLEEVMVTSRRMPAVATEPTADTAKLLAVPGSFGDPLQAIYSLPGVVPTDDGGGQPAVRGSGPEDNTFLIDFLPASYLFHDFGNSIFNENLLRDFGLKAAGFGSRYGRATGAVFDVSLREPRRQRPTTTIDANLLRAGGLLEGGIDDTQSFYLAARSSVTDLLLDAVGYEPDKAEDTTFQQFPQDRDYQAKYSWQVDPRQRLSVSVLGARDRAAATFGARSDDALLDPGSTGRASLDTQFDSQGLHWWFDGGDDRLRSALGHLHESRLDQQGSGAEYLNLDLDQWTLKSHYDRRISQTHTVAAGFEYQRSTYDYTIRARFRSCSIFSPDCATDHGKLTLARDTQRIATADAFLEDIWNLTSDLRLTSGVHFDRNDYLRESHAEPRLAAQWQLGAQLEVHASWGRYHQLPRIDQIVPVFGNPQLESPQATHYVLGASYQLGGIWSMTADVYYKDLDRVVVDTQEPVLYVNDASGKSYGAEVLINRDRQDRWYGWLSLSLSRTERLNALTGATTAFDYDAPVVANLVLNYRFNARWEMGARWNFRSGMPYTPIIGNKPNPDYPGYYLPVYGPLNSQRAEPYHRLDLRVERKFDHGRVKGSYYVDIINAYARSNGGAVRYEAIAGSSNYRLAEEKGLPLFPSFGVKITF